LDETFLEMLPLFGSTPVFKEESLRLKEPVERSIDRRYRGTLAESFAERLSTGRVLL
jgi:hypothetical protein